MREFPEHIEKLINHFSRLPGIGPRSAFRMISYLLKMPEHSLTEFGADISDLKSKVKFCNKCFNICDGFECNICADKGREENTILIVEDVLDLVAFERVGEYIGKYHVLGGVLSPLRGVGPEEIRIEELMLRLNQLSKKYDKIELIIATNPNLEGEATAMYIKRSVENNKKIVVSRIARGIPNGAEIDYADNSTLSQALIRRMEY